MYNGKLVYKVVIWAFFGISLWKKKVALTTTNYSYFYLIAVYVIASLSTQKLRTQKVVIGP